jgi:hypothetical protein
MSELTAGYTKPLCASTGGVKEVILYNLVDRDTFVRADNEITAIALLALKTGFSFKVDMQSSSFTETQTRSRENNSVYFEQTGVIILKDDANETTNLIEMLGCPFLGVIAILESGKVFHYGLENGMSLSTSEKVTGQNYEDMNGVTINLVGREKLVAPYMTEILATGIL